MNKTSQNISGGVLQTSQESTNLSQGNVPLIETTKEKPPIFSKIKEIFTNNKKIFIAVGVSFILLIILIAVFFIYKSLKSKQRMGEEQRIGEEQAGPYKINYEFAKFKLVNTAFKPQLPDYSISLPEITNLSAFETSIEKPFSDSQKGALTNTNFFITQNLDEFYDKDLESPNSRSDDWTKLYADIGGGAIGERKQENSVFVTSDFLLHVYHRLLEKEFEYIEKNNFYPTLKEMTDKVFSKSLDNYSKEIDKDNRESYERIIAFFAVPKAILDSAYPEFSSKIPEDQNLDSNENILKVLDTLKTEMPDSSYQKAKQELNLIMEKGQVTPSPIFGELLSNAKLQTNQDYTQFTPRSHYNKNSVLRVYFRAMMWYGRNYFPLLSSPLTQDAINITLLMKETGQFKNWESIYVPTAFLVGKSDDLGIYEYSTSLENMKGENTANSDLVSRVQKDMESYKGPQIQSSAFFREDIFGTTKEELIQKTKGFRFMGQRFTPDAFVFSSLTQGDEKSDPKTGEKLPSSTTALMVMTVLGNKTSEPLTQDWISTNASNSKNVLADKIGLLKQQFEKLPQDVWTQNIYWGWLFTIKSLFTENFDKTGYPMFIKNDDWNKKNLLASLGSWTELKHDTLLYAKQSYAEMGGGGEPPEPPPVPKGYVEPNIMFFDRLIALSEMSMEGLKNRNLIDSLFIGRNEIFIKSLKFFRDIAVKELQNEKISDDDFETLRNEAGRLDNILDALPGEEMLEKNARSALIADVHTDTIKGEILYEANGIPNYIYVTVKDQNGTRLTKGLVFSYYEFTNPLSERLTDEKWREMNYTQDKSKLPPAPSWSKSLIK